jgi:hypothetical protein
MAGSPATDAYNEAGNSDFSRKAMGLAEDMLTWAAPKAISGGPNSKRADRGAGGPDLQEQATNWSSPKASDPEKAGPNMRGSKGDLPLPGPAAQWPGPDATNRVRDAETLAKCAEFRLRNAGQKTVPLYLAEVAANWAGPAAQNHKGSSQGSVYRQDGKSRDDLLHYQAEQFFRPPSSLDQPIAAGSMSSTDGPNSNQPSVKRKLNPIFVEALMRWPTGLSGFERQEMAWTRWWQLMPSFVSTLVSTPSERQGSLL